MLDIVENDFNVVKDNSFLTVIEITEDVYQIPSVLVEEFNFMEIL